jgi:hypothetical protein
MQKNTTLSKQFQNPIKKIVKKYLQPSNEMASDKWTKNNVMC